MCDTPEVTRGDIAAGLRELGLAAGDGVMVHSSLNCFGRVAGGAEAVIDALRDVLTESGVILMPSFNHGRIYKIDDPPGIFDPTTSYTVNGRIPKTFWRQQGVLRSWQPTHAFAAWGRRAREYTQYHHRALTCGPGSPLGMLYRDGGYGLLLGVRWNVNTFHHVVEQCVAAPCLGRRATELPMRLPDGRIVPARTWSWRKQGCPITDQARYGELMESRGLVKFGQIGGCRAKLFRLADCYDLLAELFANGLDEFPPCSRCSIRPNVYPETVESDWDEANQCLKPDSPAWQY